MTYHRVLAQIAGLVYGYPSRKMIVVGVTGTAGKSTTVNLIAKALEASGQKVGLASTMNFQIGDKRWTNATKMTMLGRFALQKMLCEMLRAGCRYAVIETSSEGIRNSRHLEIDYDAAVLTNLTPEHIESHGSFEKYRAEKEKLFAQLSKSYPKAVGGRRIVKLSVINVDDPNSGNFWQYEVEKRLGYGLDPELPDALHPIIPQNLAITSSGTTFSVNGVNFRLNLPGRFNVYNALAAIAVAIGWGLDLNQVSAKLAEVTTMDGRMEQIDCGQPFKIYVDYAHTPESLEQVYQTLRAQLDTPNRALSAAPVADAAPIPAPAPRLIAVLGSCGGGRDKAKRPILGRLAGQYADIAVITNEDPYDERPEAIIEQVAAGAEEILAAGHVAGATSPAAQFNAPKKPIPQLFKILDRREAIAKACQLARAGDIIVITGKGNEQWLMGPRGSRIPWDDRLVVKEVLGC